MGKFLLIANYSLNNTFNSGGYYTFNSAGYWILPIIFLMTLKNKDDYSLSLLGFLMINFLNCCFRHDNFTIFKDYPPLIPSLKSVFSNNYFFIVVNKMY